MRLRSAAASAIAVIAPTVLAAATVQAGQVKASPGGSLMVLFSTEQNGNLTPCGCSKPMLGGMPRRATYMAGLPSKGAQLRVDNGDLTLALGRQDELKAETLVEMLNALEYDALNLGEKDIRLGKGYIESLQARFKGSLLCANLRKADGTAYLKETAVVQKTVGERSAKAVIVGLLSPKISEPALSDNKDFAIETPAAALTRLQESIKQQAECRILLYHGPKAEAEQLARQFPLFQLIVYGHEGDAPLDPVTIGSTTLVCNGQDGKYAGLASFPNADLSKPAQVTFTKLGPEFADDAALMQIKGVYIDRVIGEDLLSQVARNPNENGDTFAGNEACLGCHQKAKDAWLKSGHAHALRTLAEVRHDRDPECVQCHVVGLDRESGFSSHDKTPRLENVGCESCHGPAAKHVANPTVKLVRAGLESCSPCHVPQHSPNFDFEKYWPKIKH